MLAVVVIKVRTMKQRAVCFNNVSIEKILSIEKFVSEILFTFSLLAAESSLVCFFVCRSVCH